MDLAREQSWLMCGLGQIELRDVMVHGVLLRRITVQLDRRHESKPGLELVHGDRGEARRRNDPGDGASYEPVSRRHGKRLLVELAGRDGPPSENLRGGRRQARVREDRAEVVATFEAYVMGGGFLVPPPACGARVRARVRVADELQGIRVGRCAPTEDASGLRRRQPGNRGTLARDVDPETAPLHPAFDSETLMALKRPVDQPPIEHRRHGRGARGERVHGGVEREEADEGPERPVVAHQALAIVHLLLERRASGEGGRVDLHDALEARPFEARVARPCADDARRS